MLLDAICPLEIHLELCISGEIKIKIDEIIIMYENVTQVYNKYFDGKFVGIFGAPRIKNTS